ncbi:hypothetical protein JXB02_05630 [Candidatus Woesearchaeota archaeon]|nr:hypothetical protein [Candidatus Woesearchaeota archaeon]
MAGEIDLLGIKGDRVDVYEVKCSHRLVKARRQLRKIRKLLDLENITTYFYCGASRHLELII